MGHAVLRTVASAVLLHSLAFAQAPQTAAPDPLEHLLADDRPERDQIRLHVTLLRVPMHTAAEALLANTAAAEDGWRTRLKQWREAGQLELVTQCRTDEVEGRESEARFSQRHHYVPQSAASQFWFQLQRAKDEEGRTAPDYNELLQDIAKEETGTSLKAKLIMQKGWRQASVTVDFCYTPDPDQRAATTWPLPNFPTPRWLFRPWRLKTAAFCTVKEPFLLGAQMEPPHDGGIHTGHVLMAFGRITLPEKSGREFELAQSHIEPAHQVQTWTLAVPRDLFLPWIANRKNSEGDSKTLNSWVGQSGKGAPVKLLATSAAAAGMDSSLTELTSTLRWTDMSGFEPGGTRTQFRPLGNEDRTFFLEHGLAVEMVNVPAEGAPFADPFGKSPPESRSNLWGLHLTVSRPSTATVWKKMPFTMEQAADDSQSLELGEADMFRPSERIDSAIILAPGRTVLAGAALKQEHAHVTFVRLTQIQSPPAPPRDAKESESGVTTVWTIETPVSWQNRLLGPDNINFKALAGDLLNAKPAEARIVAVSTMPHRRGEIVATSPKIFLGGAYVNTAPAPKGIFFNMRELGFEGVGDTVEANLGPEEEKQQAMFHCKIRSVGAPEWRHWGIWQPAVESMRAPRLAGIEQPVFPCLRLEQILRTDLSVPQVVAVIGTSNLGSAAKAPPGHLRWIVAQRDGDGHRPKNRPVSNSFAAYADNPRTVQAIVVGKAPKDPLDAAHILEQVRDGALPVLDLITLRASGSRKTSAAAGHDFYFTNARGGPDGAQRLDPIKETAAMPKGTWFSNQIRLENRIVGFQLSLEGGEWQVTRDAQAPEIITDTFHDARLEWPWPDVEKLPPVTINVQRPIFSVQEARGDIPAMGEATATRLSNDSVLFLRTLP